MKKIIILFIILILSVGGTIGCLYWKKDKESKFLSNNSQTKDAYAIIKKREDQLKKDKYNYDALMSIAFHWKGIGEVTKNNEYLLRAVKFYDKVIEHWGAKAYLPLYNQANVYILLKKYDKAESNLKISLEIDPGEQNLYIALTDLYKDYMKKSDAEIRTVYEKGIKTVVSGGNLVLNYAIYLRDTNDYKEAMKYYRMLEKAYPSNTGYGEVIKELEEKLPKT